MTPGAHLGTVTLRGRPLRQYAAMHGEPDHPWTLVADFAAFVGMDDDYLAGWLNELRRTFTDMLAELPDGRLIVAESWVSGLFQVWTDAGYKIGSLADDWHDGWWEVFAAHHAHLPRAEWLAVCQQAGLRSMPHVPGVTVVQ